MTILTIIGTRPEAIKMAPVLRELSRQAGRGRSLLCVTGQHRELIAPVLALFRLTPDYSLSVMRPGQSLAQLTAALCTQLDPVVEQAGPDWILAQGDTTTALAASLVAHYHHVQFAHVEAGLRTGNKFRPFPEELNRRVADLAADLLFAPTEQARRNLLREGCAPENIHVTGNTVVDAVQEIARRPFAWRKGPWTGLLAAKRVVVVTIHRRESFGAPLREICAALRELAGRFRSGEVQFIFPVHLNPGVHRPVHKWLAGVPNLCLIEPLDYLTMVHLMKRASLILTDSGGIQEEAPSLGVPVVVVRDQTERPEGIQTGLIRLAGTTRAGIVEAARLCLEQTPPGRASRRPVPNPYGDGRAAARIVSILLGPPPQRRRIHRAAQRLDSSSGGLPHLSSR